MSSENAEEVLADPDLVMKLYMCPFCEGKLNSLEAADKHVITFHRISKDMQEKLNLKTKEVLL